MLPVSGSGGGKSPKQYKPKTKPDTLDSTQYLQCIDLLSEGEIEGFPSDHPMKDIYLDGTPLMRASANVNAIVASDYNFPSVGIAIAYGTGNQAPIPGFSTVEKETSVGVDITESYTPVTRTITDTNVNAVRFTLTWPRLERYTDKGDTLEARIAWEVLLSYNGGPFTSVHVEDLTGRSGNTFQRTALVTLSGAFPVDVRVQAWYLDPLSSKIQNAFAWTSYTEIVYATLAYPYRAYIGLRAPASSFASLPTRSYRLRGIKVLIPSNATVNYTDGSLSYTGVWDGTFQSAKWTTDPVWILFDLLLNKRYGTGDHVPASAVNKWTFYTASLYSNERVPTGVGANTEPRFSCHANINTLTEAYKLINDLASVCRCMPYWSAGGVTLTQDRPGDIAAIFTQANVVDGVFSYSSSSKTQRHTVAAVSWLDRDRQELSYEFVEDRDGIARYGVQRIDVTGFACSSRSQARRTGLTILATERYETDVVTFSVGIDTGAHVRTGMIIAIEDTVRTSGARYAGRITGGSYNTVEIDVPASALPSIATPTILVTQIDGSVASRAVSSVAGNVLYLATGLPGPAAPLVGGVYIYNDVLSKWRVLSVKDTGPATYEVTALQYNEARYANVDRYIPLGEYTITTKVQFSTRVGALSITAAPSTCASAYSQTLYTPVSIATVASSFAACSSVYSEQYTTQAGTAIVEARFPLGDSLYSQTKYTAAGHATISASYLPLSST